MIKASFGLTETGSVRNENQDSFLLDVAKGILPVADGLGGLPNGDRASKLTLCIGDRIRFGDVEIPLEQLTAIFGKHATTRLEARRFPVRSGKTVARPMTGKQDQEAALQKPRRNPVTGKIEEQRTMNTDT